MLEGRSVLMNRVVCFLQLDCILLFACFSYFGYRAIILFDPPRPLRLRLRFLRLSLLRLLLLPLLRPLLLLLPRPRASLLRLYHRGCGYFTLVTFARREHKKCQKALSQTIYLPSHSDHFFLWQPWL